MNAGRVSSRDRLRAAALELVDALAEVIAEAAAGAGRPERLLDYPEVARRLGVHPKTARRAGAAGAWPEVRTFGGVKVREVDLDAAIAASPDGRRPRLVAAADRRLARARRGAA